MIGRELHIKEIYFNLIFFLCKKFYLIELITN